MDDDNVSLDLILNNCDVEYEKTERDKKIILDLYQIDGVINENFAYLKFIGKNNHRPVILIKELYFKGKRCQLVSYILTNIDLKHDMKMLGLLICDKDKVIASITLSFVPDINNNIIECIKEPIVGRYIYRLRTLKDGHDEIITTYDKFIGKSESLYELIRLLSNKKLIFLFD